MAEFARSPVGADPHTGGLSWDARSGVRCLDLERRLWQIDGVGPVPEVVARVIAEGPLPWRLARYGYLKRIVTHDFGPPLGSLQVYLCEKYALMHIPANKSPWDCQGVALSNLPAVLGSK